MMLSEEKIKQWLEKTESDERLHYKPATVFENAPLALIQMSLETKSLVLRAILGLPMCKHHPDGKWEPE